MGNKIEAYRSIRTKLSGLVLASVLSGTSIVTGLFVWRDVERQTALDLDRMRASTAVLASLTAEAAASNDGDGVFKVLRTITALPDLKYARLDTPLGTLAETGTGARLGQDLVLADGETDLQGAAAIMAALRTRSVEMHAPVILDKRKIGTVVVLGQLEGAFDRLVASLLVSLSASLAAIGLGLLVAARLQRQITRPLLALKASITEIREQKGFHKTVEVQSNDEVGDLVGGFNAMLSEVRTRDLAMADHLAGLEQTVALRTKELRAARDVAEQANAAKSDFLATMSHEIRTPMNGVMVMAEMLSREQLPPRQRRFADVIARSSSNLLSIINDILDFAKIEAGKIELENIGLNLADLADEVCDLFWEQAAAKGVDLAVWVDPAVARTVRGDPVRLRQILSNLVSNAIKFTPQGGVLISIAPDGGEGGLRIAVQDSGIGIAADKISGLFSAFNQADQSTTRRFGGTGLGLAISKRLVQAMGGRLSVKSAEGKGSTFSFLVKLPMVEGPRPWPVFEGGQVALSLEGPALRAVVKRYLVACGLQVSKAESPQSLVVIADPKALAGRPSGVVPAVCLAGRDDPALVMVERAGRASLVLNQPLRREDLRDVLDHLSQGLPLTTSGLAQDRRLETLMSFAGRRVLVVDDSAVNREVALEALGRLEAEGIAVETGREAVTEAQSGGFDLILMDGSMPDMDGYEATRLIRAHERDTGAARVPIIALTAHVLGPAAQAWRAAGMDDVVHKPFGLKQLSDALERLIPSSGPLPDAPLPSAVIVPLPLAVKSSLLDPTIGAELQAIAARGNPEFVARVRKLYEDNAPAAADAVIRAVAEGDMDAVAKSAHALRSMSLNLGATAVAQAAGDLEQRARRGDVLSDNDGTHLSTLLTDTLVELLGAPAAQEPAEAPRDNALLADLAVAAARNEFSLVYQPQVGPDSRTVVGVEALLRWDHPVRGRVSPADFIPLAEGAGIIRPITRWVLRTAIEQMSQIDTVAISINASALEFAEKGFYDEVVRALATFRFPASRLEIEITETSMLTDGEAVHQAIERFHDLGVRVALDDFGTGYSSLNQLRLYRLDKVKIDRSFIVGCPDESASSALVLAVISIARALGMKVVAEGVETEAQRKFLKIAGAHAIQGYIHDRPLPFEEFKARWIEPQAEGEARPRLAL
jgi:EAL domain-containing protein (putative c-di-GMP-specific phosphodiesterase class I)/signal transduction histidine kinase/CheY-like chemotaxis protein